MPVRRSHQRRAISRLFKTPLSPTLKPGDVVILDNLGSHKGKAVRAANRAAGAHLLFLPKHSPDPNPIKQVSAKLKTLIRKNGAGPYDALGDAAAETLAKFTTPERAAYLKKSGRP